MAAKLNTTKRIPLSTGSRGPQSSGKTVPGPGAPHGGGKVGSKTADGQDVNVNECKTLRHWHLLM
jgi:hypothetical protein